MESINQIEIQGITGSVKIIPVPGSRVARFSLATNYSYRAKDGTMFVDTTWFNVSAFEGDKIRCLDQLQKGAKVHVLGRVRMQRYTDDNGSDRTCWEIVAQELNIVED